jgi:hypothetical protein
MDISTSPFSVLTLPRDVSDYGTKLTMLTYLAGKRTVAEQIATIVGVLYESSMGSPEFHKAVRSATHLPINTGSSAYVRTVTRVQSLPHHIMTSAYLDNVAYVYAMLTVPKSKLIRFQAMQFVVLPIIAIDMIHIWENTRDETGDLDLDFKDKFDKVIALFDHALLRRLIEKWDELVLESDKVPK